MHFRSCGEYMMRYTLPPHHFLFVSTLEFRSAYTPPFVSANTALYPLGGMSPAGGRTTFQTGQTRPILPVLCSLSVANYTDGFTYGHVRLCVSGSIIRHMIDLFLPKNGECVECCTYVVERRARGLWTGKMIELSGSMSSGSSFTYNMLHLSATRDPEQFVEQPPRGKLGKANIEKLMLMYDVLKRSNLVTPCEGGWCNGNLKTWKPYKAWQKGGQVAII